MILCLKATTIQNIKIEIKKAAMAKIIIIKMAIHIEVEIITKKDFGSFKQNHQNKKSYYKNTEKTKNTETIADIKLDIERIEKEIRLEIKEIKSLKLGV